MSVRETIADALLQETFLGEAFDNFDAAVFLADENGKYLAVNRAACRLTGYTREELISIDVNQVAVDPSDYAPMVEGQKREGEVVLRRKDGSLVEVDWRAGATKIGGMPFYVGLCWPRA